MKKSVVNLTIAGFFAITLAACFDKPLETLSPAFVEEDQVVSQEKNQCVNEMNVIGSFNNAMNRQIESFLDSIEDSKEEVKRYDIEIVRLTAPHLSCLYDGEPVEIPNTCSAYQDMAEYLISQRKVEPIIKDKDRIYSLLVTRFNTVLDVLKRDMNEVGSVLIEYQPTADQGQDSECLGKLDHINNINNLNIDRIDSLISSVEESEASIRESHSHILDLTINNLSYMKCFITDDPLIEIPHTCTSEDLTNYLISQRRAEPVKHNKKATYIRLIAKVERSLRNINADIKSLQLL